MGVGTAGVDQGEPAESLQSTGELFSPGDVIKLCHPSRLHSFALYCGHGRVIHAWTSSRANYRVRVDTLRSLQASGIAVSDATEEMDAYCAEVLGAAPLSAQLIIPRARQALHCPTTGRRSTLLLIFYARYGGILETMIKSLFSVSRTLIRLSAPEALSSSNVSLREALGTILHQIDKKNYAWPRGVNEQTHLDTGEVTLRVAEALVQNDVNAMCDIKSILRSDVEPLMAAWIMFTSKVTTSPVNGNSFESHAVGLPLCQLGAQAKCVLLAFHVPARQFTVLLDTDKTLIDRLARERMECGICFESFRDTKAMLLQCSHVVCVKCFGMLKFFYCPYCRMPIGFTREMDTAIKLVVIERIRQSECSGLAANDTDASLQSMDTALSEPPNTCGQEGTLGHQEAAFTATKSESDEPVTELTQDLSVLEV